MKNLEKSELLNLFIKREVQHEETGRFLDLHTDSDGTISVEDADTADKQLKEIETMTAQIKSELSKPTTKPLYAPIGNYSDFYNAQKTKFGVNGDDYHREFFNAVRSGFKATNYLTTTSPAQGGYLIPTEFHDHIIKSLEEKNILREISHVISTASEHKIIIQATAPAADWISEGQTINFTSETFTKKTLGAYKLAASIRISNELLEDSYYNLENHIANEFSEAIAKKEEQAFFNGDGQGKPLGLLTQMTDPNTAITSITTAGASLNADDLINTVYALGSGYRQNASWIMNNATLAVTRKLKDANQNYLWENSLSSDTPARLLGYPVYTSENVPALAAGNLVAIFGDFSKYIIGQRGEMIFKPLHEVRALSDETVFLIIERVDAVLSDTAAIVGLKMKS